MIGRLCEEFSCLPSALMDEDFALLCRIAALRNYAKAREHYMTSDDKGKLKMTDSLELVLKVQGMKSEYLRGHSS